MKKLEHLVVEIKKKLDLLANYEFKTRYEKAQKLKVINDLLDVFIDVIIADYVQPTEEFDSKNFSNLIDEMKKSSVFRDITFIR